METQLHQNVAPTNGSMAKASSSEAITELQHDLNGLVAALALLDIKRCSQCRQFFRSTGPGVLFDYGPLVCYGCLPGWWTVFSAATTTDDRLKVAAKLASWLRKHHHAEVLKEGLGNKHAESSYAFQIVTGCLECRGSGKLLEGERCRFCNGFGTIRVAVPK